MKMTHKELAEMMEITLHQYLAEVQGRIPTHEETMDIVHWVAAQDFEETLGVVRGEIL